MSGDEIVVPKELREFMLEGAEVTLLGKSNGSKRQYRYGNLHIREYDDKFLVHVDKIDPRKDPIGHLVHDAPEVLVGLACGIFTASAIKKYIHNKSPTNPDRAFSLITSIVSGYAGYSTTKKIKKYLE